MATETTVPDSLELEGDGLLSDALCGIEGHEKIVVYFSWREGLCVDVRSAETGNYARMTLTPDQADHVADQLRTLSTWRRAHG